MFDFAVGRHEKTGGGNLEELLIASESRLSGPQWRLRRTRELGKVVVGETERKRR